MDAIIHSSSVVNNSKLGKYTRIKELSEVRDSNIGDYSYLSRLTMVNKTKIGNFTSVGPGVHIGLWEHNTDVTTHTFYLYETSGGFVKGYKNFKKDHLFTEIGADVWIGSYAVIKKGVKVGNGAIIGAGSIITKNVDDFSIVVGNPGRILRYRYDKNIINFLNDVKWWFWDRNKIKSAVHNNSFESMDNFIKFVENYEK